jgi:5-methylcytosine-specific restriction protein A
MAWAAKNQPCPRCRRRQCVCKPGDKPKPFAKSAPRAQRRPYYDKYASQRRQAVEEWRQANGDYCPMCGRYDFDKNGRPLKLTADHIDPVALGGSEDGPMGVHCIDCQRRQGSLIANEVKRRRRLGLL